jgi:hypothetical protein
MTLSSLLLAGGLLNSNSNEDAQSRRIMEVAKALTENDHNTCLGDLMELQEQKILTTAASNIEIKI